MRMHALVVTCGLITLGSPHSAAHAEILKVSISGAFGPPTVTTGGEFFKEFYLNYFVNSDEIVRYQVPDYKAYPHREIVPVYGSSGYLQEYSTVLHNYVKILEIPFHDVQGEFFGFYDDPVVLSFSVNETKYPYVKGFFRWVFFGQDFGCEECGTSPDLTLYLPGEAPQAPVWYYMTTTVLPPSSIPEPATWAMMLIGFAATGSVIRRRRLAVSYT